MRGEGKKKKVGFDDQQIRHTSVDYSVVVLPPVFKVCVE